MDNKNPINSENLNYMTSPEANGSTPSIIESPTGSGSLSSANEASSLGKDLSTPQRITDIDSSQSDQTTSNQSEKSKLSSIRDAIKNIIPKRKILNEYLLDEEDGSQQDEHIDGEIHRGSVKRKSNERLMKMMRLNAKAFFKDISSFGEENLDKIPEGADVIFLETHIQSDAEVQAGITVLGEKYDLAVTNHSSHHSPKEDLLPNLGLRVAGRDNFYPIKFIKKGKDGWPVFQPNNFTDMLPVFDDGKAVVMAAHNPVYNNKLPDQPGVGGIMLYHLADAKNGNAVIVPVAIDIKSQRSIAIGGQFIKAIGDMMPWKRPSADVHIGEPIKLDHLDVTPLVESRGNDHARPTPTDIDLVKSTNEKLREQGEVVMLGLAKLLPQEKRGSWGDTHVPIDDNTIQQSQVSE